jgi:hypothetical protein
MSATDVQQLMTHASTPAAAIAAATTVILGLIFTALALRLRAYVGGFTLRIGRIFILEVHAPIGPESTATRSAELRERLDDDSDRPAS